MTKLLRIGLIVLSAIVALWFLAATALILWPDPTFDSAAQMLPAPPKCQPSDTSRCFVMRDGVVVSGHWLSVGARTTLVYVHGAFSESAEFETMAAWLSQADVNVLGVDLRGHGNSEGQPGDTAYIGQYEDDLADVIAAIRRETPGVRVVLAGHSMGGGVVLRYAARRAQPPADMYVLFAPHLGANAPTTRAGSASSTTDTPTPIVSLHTRRLTGLLMLNLFGVTIFNGEPVLKLRLPIPLRVDHYSFRAMAGSSPDDDRDAFAADTQPMLIVAGRNDEAFDAAQYPGVAAARTNAEAVIVDGETHDSILRSRAAASAATRWLVAHVGAR